MPMPMAARLAWRGDGQQMAEPTHLSSLGWQLSTTSFSTYTHTYRHTHTAASLRLLLPLNSEIDTYTGGKMV